MGPDRSIPALCLLNFIRDLLLLATTDTGPRHFAIGFDVPYVCVMGSTDPQMTDQPEARGEARVPRAVPHDAG